MRVDAVARMMQDQMFPGEARSTLAQASGFQSGESEEVRGNKKIKTTKMSWADMAKRATAGIDTSIESI